MPTYSNIQGRMATLFADLRNVGTKLEAAKQELASRKEEVASAASSLAEVLETHASILSNDVVDLDLYSASALDRECAEIRLSGLRQEVGVMEAAVEALTVQRDDLAAQYDALSKRLARARANLIFFPSTQ